MRRYLPPLLVLAVFVLVGVRCGLEPARAEDQGQIDGLIQGGDFATADQRLRLYLGRYQEANRMAACVNGNSRRRA